MPFVSTVCHTLYYETAGNCTQPPLLLLHGFLGSHQDFELVLSMLSCSFYCILPDLPGHGKTRSQPNGYTFGKTASALRSLLDHLNIQQTHLLGYSMGGRLALYLLCKLPDYFSRAVLVSASPGLQTRAERQARLQADHQLAQVLTKTHFPDFLAQWYRNSIFAQLNQSPDIYLPMIRRRLNNNPVELASALQGLSLGAQPSIWSQLSALPHPLLLLAGAQDFKFVDINQQMLTHAQKRREDRDDAKALVRLEILPSCGHCPHLEAPEDFGQRVVQFLEAEV